MTVRIHDEDFFYLAIHPSLPSVRENLPKKFYWVCQHDEYDDLYVVFDGDPRDYEGFIHFNNVQLGFYKKKYFIDLGEYRDQRIDEIFE